MLTFSNYIEYLSEILFFVCILIFQVYVLQVYRFAKGAIVNDIHYLYKVCILLIVNALWLNIIPIYSTSESFHFSKDVYTILSVSIILFCSTFIFYACSIYNISSGISSIEFLIILLYTIFGMILILTTTSYIYFYIFLEIESVCLVLLTSIQRYDRNSIESGIKYFVVVSVSSVLLLFGVCIFYGLFGTLNFVCITSMLSILYGSSLLLTSYSFWILLGLIFQIVGFLFKLYSAPFHFWVSDIYDGSPISSTLVLSTLYYFLMVNAFVKYLFVIAVDLCVVLDTFFLFISLFTLTIGTVGALLQVRFKRIIAYSSVSVIGYILLSFSTASSTLLSSSLSMLMFYTLNVIVLLFVCLLIRFRERSILEKTTDIASIYQTYPLLSFAVFITVCSISGLPPFGGFLLKFLYFNSFAIDYQYFIFIYVSIVVLIGVYYYIRLFKSMFYMSIVYFPFFYSISICAASSILFLSICNLLFFFFEIDFLVLMDAYALSVVSTY